MVGRGEELGKFPEWKQRFPIITARSVATLNQLERWTRNLRQPQSTLYLYKGGDLTEEIASVSSVSAVKQICIHPLQLKNYSTFQENRKVIVELQFVDTVLKINR